MTVTAASVQTPSGAVQASAGQASQISTSMSVATTALEDAALRRESDALMAAIDRATATASTPPSAATEQEFTRLRARMEDYLAALRPVAAAELVARGRTMMQMIAGSPLPVAGPSAGNEITATGSTQGTGQTQSTGQTQATGTGPEGTGPAETGQRQQAAAQEPRDADLRGDAEAKRRPAEPSGPTLSQPSSPATALPSNMTATLPAAAALMATPASQNVLRGADTAASAPDLGRVETSLLKEASAGASLPSRPHSLPGTLPGQMPGQTAGQIAGQTSGQTAPALPQSETETGGMAQGAMTTSLAPPVLPWPAAAARRYDLSQALQLAPEATGEKIDLRIGQALSSGTEARALPAADIPKSGTAGLAQLALAGEGDSSGQAALALGTTARLILSPFASGSAPSLTALSLGTAANIRG